MYFMTNITFKVWDMINNDPSIKRGLARGITNQRALAKYLLEKKEIDASLDAVITAIRRYHGDNAFKDRFDNAILDTNAGCGVFTKESKK